MRDWQHYMSTDEGGLIIHACEASSWCTMRKVDWIGASAPTATVAAVLQRHIRHRLSSVSWVHAAKYIQR